MSLIAGGRDLNRITLCDRPLIVCDIDEAVLEFITPLQTFLATRGYKLIPRSFRLTAADWAEAEDLIRRHIDGPGDRKTTVPPRPGSA